MDNKDRSENIKWGIKTAANLGTSRIYDKACYGYQHDKNGKLAVKEDEAENVRLIFRFYLGGHSVVSIIDRLKSKNIKSPSGKDRWSKRTIEKMLGNIKYTGDAIVKTENYNYVIKDHHPAIISRDVFDAVQFQQKLRSNIEPGPDGTVSRRPTKYSKKKARVKTVIF